MIHFQIRYSTVKASPGISFCWVRDLCAVVPLMIRVSMSKKKKTPLFPSVSHTHKFYVQECCDRKHTVPYVIISFQRKTCKMLGTCTDVSSLQIIFFFHSHNQISFISAPTDPKNVSKRISLCGLLELSHKTNCSLNATSIDHNVTVKRTVQDCFFIPIQPIAEPL